LTVLVNLLNHNLYVVNPVANALFLLYTLNIFMALQWQNFVLQLPMDHTVLLNFAQLFYSMYIFVVSWI